MNSQACFRAAAIPDAAHDINLHRNAQQLYDQIAYFADQAMGDRGQNVGSYRSTCATRAPSLGDALPTPIVPGVAPPPPGGVPLVPAGRG